MSKQNPTSPAAPTGDTIKVKTPEKSGVAPTPAPARMVPPAVAILVLLLCLASVGMAVYWFVFHEDRVVVVSGTVPPVAGRTRPSWSTASPTATPLLKPKKIPTTPKSGGIWSEGLNRMEGGGWNVVYGGIYIRMLPTARNFDDAEISYVRSAPNITQDQIELGLLLSMVKSPAVAQQLKITPEQQARLHQIAKPVLRVSSDDRERLRKLWVAVAPVRGTEGEDAALAQLKTAMEELGKKLLPDLRTQIADWETQAKANLTREQYAQMKQIWQDPSALKTLRQTAATAAVTHTPKPTTHVKPPKIKSTIETAPATTQTTVKPPAPATTQTTVKPPTSAPTSQKTP